MRCKFSGGCRFNAVPKSNFCQTHKDDPDNVNRFAGIQIIIPGNLSLTQINNRLSSEAINNAANLVGIEMGISGEGKRINIVKFKEAGDTAEVNEYKIIQDENTSQELPGYSIDFETDIFVNNLQHPVLVFKKTD